MIDTSSSDSRSRDIWFSLHSIFSALEKVLIVVGVPIAAYWTYFTFSANDSQKARLKYETDLALAKSQGIQIDINSQTDLLKSSGIIYGVIKIQNFGANYINIDRQTPDLISIARVEIDQSGKAKMVDRKKITIEPDEKLNFRYSAIAPQRTAAIPFAAGGLRSDSLYVVRFRADVRFSTQTGMTTPRRWSEMTIISAK